MTMATWVWSSPRVKLKEAQKDSLQKYFLILYFMIVLESQKIQGRTASLRIPTSGFLTLFLLFCNRASYISHDALLQSAKISGGCHKAKKRNFFLVL